MVVVDGRRVTSVTLSLHAVLNVSVRVTSGDGSKPLRSPVPSTVITAPVAFMLKNLVPSPTLTPSCTECPVTWEVVVDDHRPFVGQVVLDDLFAEEGVGVEAHTSAARSPG